MSGFKDGLGDKPYTPYYPDRAGFKEPTTSQEAAEAIETGGRAATLRERVAACLGERERTADEVAHALGESVLAIRPRLSELRHANRIQPTGERRKNASGVSAHVWRTI